LLFSHLYPNPGAAIAFAEGIQAPQDELIKAAHHFEDFFEEVFSEFCQFGEILDMIVADNIGEHMLGNLYIKFATEEQAETALRTMTGKYYNQAPIQVEYSPVSDFREAKCRQYTDGQCERGGYCNFIHPKHISLELRRRFQ
jgi:splicing factor U2AF subunit